MINPFLRVLNISIAAGWFVLAVVVLRLALKKAPKWIHVLLWGLVAVRLLLPFSIESALSLIPSAETIPDSVLTGPSFDVQTGIPPVDDQVNDYLGDHCFEGVTTPTGNGQSTIAALSLIWMAGMAIMGLYTLFSYRALRKKVSTAVRERSNIFRSEFVGSPFVLGIFKPKIYLPASLPGKDTALVVAHEQAHIRRKDHWWKPLGFLLLAVHWFNPLMWLAYVLLCRDIEMACDEKVIRQLGCDQRAEYSQALLSCSISRRSIAACPLAFGEAGVKERVKNVLHYKKPAFWVILLAVIVCMAAAVCFLTDPVTEEPMIEDTVPAPEPLPTVTVLYDANDPSYSQTTQFTLDAFPGFVFHMDPAKGNSEIVAIKDDQQTTIISSFHIECVYAADLNGDGCPEICVNDDPIYTNYGSYVTVYDLANQAHYILGGTKALAYAGKYYPYLSTSYMSAISASHFLPAYHLSSGYSYHLRIEDGFLVCDKESLQKEDAETVTGRLALMETADGAILYLAALAD